MAGVLSVPYLLANGEPFPQRPLLIFIAAGVILFTLLAATFCLPLLGKKEAGGKPAADFSLIKKTFFLEVIRRIKLEMKEENRAAAYELINEYRSRIRQIDLELSTETRFQQRRLTAIRLRALKEERLHVRQRRDRQEIDAAVLSLLEEALNRREHALLANAGSDFWYSLQQLIRDWRQSLPAASPVKADSTQALLAQAAQWQALQAAYYFLENYVKNHPQSTKSIYRVMAEYRTMMERLQKPRRQNRQKRDEQKEDLRLQIMDIERSEIRRMLEDGEISREQAKELRRFVNNIESITLYEYVE